jgi:hypothetical protein
MNSRNHNSCSTVKCKACEMNFFNIPVECLRKVRSLNVDAKSAVSNVEVYKILRSSNGRKIFT